MFNEILRDDLVDDHEIARSEPPEQQAFESIRVRDGHRAPLCRGTERRRPCCAWGSIVDLVARRPGDRS
jgi:hypothetical protein